MKTPLRLPPPAAAGAPRDRPRPARGPGRAAAGALAFVACALVAATAWAGPYLDRAGLLVGEMRRANEFLQAHAGDKELAALVREGAEARVRAARKMSVPKEVVAMHPHLLLALENAERAAAAAQEGTIERFGHHLRLSREEESAFRSMLAQQKYDLPAVAGK